MIDAMTVIEVTAILVVGVNLFFGLLSLTLITDFVKGITWGMDIVTTIYVMHISWYWYKIKCRPRGVRK